MTCCSCAVIGIPYSTKWSLSGTYFREEIPNGTSAGDSVSESGSINISNASDTTQREDGMCPARCQTTTFKGRDISTEGHSLCGHDNSSNSGNPNGSLFHQHLQALINKEVLLSSGEVKQNYHQTINILTEVKEELSCGCKKHRITMVLQYLWLHPTW